MEKQPHEPAGNLANMPKCGATTRKGTPCQRVGTKRNGRCRLHGGAQGIGAPEGNTNALKHGFYTAEAIAYRKRLKKFMQQGKKIMQQI